MSEKLDRLLSTSEYSLHRITLSNSDAMLTNHCSFSNDKI